MGVLEQAYNTAMEKPLRVLEIFNEFFGEEKVDMQGFPTLADVESVLSDTSDVAAVKLFIARKISGNKGFILVHWPHVRITNEYDKFTDINHLYAKVIMDVEGRIQGRFLLNRSDYTVLHFTNGYMHSHISSIPTHNFKEFQTPCTGSGPINNTICSLARDFDEDLWRLFCLELDRYVQVESIAGTPYHRLEGLVAGGRGYARMTHIYIPIDERIDAYSLGGRGEQLISFPQLAEFTKYVIDSNILKFSYREGRYCLAMSPTEYYIKLSNLFIRWYNKQLRLGNATRTVGELLSGRVIDRYKFVNNQIVKESDYRMDYRPYLGELICTFKGQPVRLTVSDATSEEAPENDIIVLNQNIGAYILTKIFNVINFRYGNNKEQGTEPCKKVYFI